MERGTLQSQKKLLGHVALLTLLFIVPATGVQGVVTLQVTGGAGAPGDSVDIVFSVSGLDTPAATAQADILVDNNVLLLHGGAVPPGVPVGGDLSEACRLDPRLSQQTGIASLPAYELTPTPPGKVRLRLIVLTLTAPITTFGDGPLIACTFQIAPTAPCGDHNLDIVRIQAADNVGRIFDSIGVPGSITVSAPAGSSCAATPAPRPTFTPTTSPSPAAATATSASPTPGMVPTSSSPSSGGGFAFPPGDSGEPTGEPMSNRTNRGGCQVIDPSTSLDYALLLPIAALTALRRYSWRRARAALVQSAYATLVAFGRDY